jgi:beta-glucosidase
MAVKAGCDMDCGDSYAALNEAVSQGLIDEAALDIALTRAFVGRFRLGMFDPADQVPYANIPYSMNNAPQHRALALRAARESIVLLKNDGILPLSDVPRKIAVIGVNADDAEVLLGNYKGKPSSSVTPLQGIRNRVGNAAQVTYATGGTIVTTTPEQIAEAVALAQEADVVIYVGGLCQALEGEEGQQEGLPAGLVSQGDRLKIELPDAQETVLKTLHATGKPLILVLLNGSAVAVNWAHDHAAAIVETWYGGEEAGTALAEVLFGDTNPAGRLPVTFYKSTEDLPPFEDYNMQGRTYRYFNGEVLYPFGYGLSYTTFAYDHLHVEVGESVTVTADVTNTGTRDGDEVVQVYISAHSEGYPLRQLVAFERVPLAVGETRAMTFVVPMKHFTCVHDDGTRTLDPCEFTISVGGGQPVTKEVVAGRVTVGL